MKESEKERRTHSTQIEERDSERKVGGGRKQGEGWTDDRFGSGWKKGVVGGIEQEEKTDEVSGPLDW